MTPTATRKSRCAGRVASKRRRRRRRGAACPLRAGGFPPCPLGRCTCSAPHASQAAASETNALSSGSEARITRSRQRSQRCPAHRAAPARRWCATASTAGWHATAVTKSSPASPATRKSRGVAAPACWCCSRQRGPWWHDRWVGHTPAQRSTAPGAPPQTPHACHGACDAVRPWSAAVRQQRRAVSNPRSGVGPMGPMLSSLSHPAPRCARACSNTYSVLNALAGHYNSFGTTAPIPKKRLERINKVRAAAGTCRAAQPQVQPWAGGRGGGGRGGGPLRGPQQLSAAAPWHLCSASAAQRHATLALTLAHLPMAGLALLPCRSWQTRSCCCPAAGRGARRRLAVRLPAHGRRRTWCGQRCDFVAAEGAVRSLGPLQCIFEPGARGHLCLAALDSVVLCAVLLQDARPGAGGACKLASLCCARTASRHRHCSRRPARPPWRCAAAAYEQLHGGCSPSTPRLCLLTVTASPSSDCAARNHREHPGSARDTPCCFAPLHPAGRAGRGATASVLLAAHIPRSTRRLVAWGPGLRSRVQHPALRSKWAS